MKTLVIYYSYTGHCKKHAEDTAKKENASLCEVKDVKRPGTIKAYTMGSFASIRGKNWNIAPIKEDLNAYEKIIILGPIWANKPAPEVNSIFEALPKGKDVSVILVSGSGKSSSEAHVRSCIERQGCRLGAYQDIRS